MSACGRVVGVDEPSVAIDNDLCRLGVRGPTRKVIDQCVVPQRPPDKRRFGHPRRLRLVTPW